MPSYKLLYVDARGRAEVARIMFHLAGQSFEDKRYRMVPEDWGKAKTDKKMFPLGQGPVLMIDDHAMPQSKAIWRYLAKEFGFFGANNMEAAKIDVIIDTIDDIEQKLIPIIREKDPEKKAELLKAFHEDVKVYFTFLEVSTKRGKYIVGDKLSLADIVVFCSMQTLSVSTFAVEGILDPYPGLKDFMTRVQEDPKLKPYLTSRPPADF